MLKILTQTTTKTCNKALSILLIPKRNAGHSKWQNIRHIKGAKDAEKAALFTKLSRQMKVAAQEGGSLDPKNNLKLEQIIEQAKRVNMPAASIQSILKSMQQDKSQCKSHIIEIRGPGSSMILCEVFTSNLYHLKCTITTILKKTGCKFSDGGGLHLFEEKGIVEASPTDNKPGENVLEVATEHAIEAGAEDVKEIEENVLEFTCSRTALKSVTTKLGEFNYNILSSSVEFIPLKMQNLSDSELKTCQTLYEKLENLPEVVRISDNIA